MRLPAGAGQAAGHRQHHGAAGRQPARPGRPASHAAGQGDTPLSRRRSRSLTALSYSLALFVCFSFSQADALEKGQGPGVVGGPGGPGGGSKGFGRLWEDCWALPCDGDPDPDRMLESSFSERRMVEMMRLGSRSGSHGDSSNATRTATAHTYTSNGTSLASASSSSLTPAHCHSHIHSHSHSGDDQDQYQDQHQGHHRDRDRDRDRDQAEQEGDGEGPGPGFEEDSSPNKSVDVSFGSIYPLQDILSPGIPALVARLR